MRFRRGSRKMSAKRVGTFGGGHCRAVKGYSRVQRVTAFFEDCFPHSRRYIMGSRMSTAGYTHNVLRGQVSSFIPVPSFRRASQ